VAKRINPTRVAAKTSGGIQVRATATLTIISLALILSLITWYLFYVTGMPLTAKETSVVTGFWLIIVILSRRSWKWFLARRGRRTDK